MANRGRRRARGFTLVEIMIVVAVVTVLTGLAIYGLTNATRAARVSGMRFTLMTLLNQAHQRAVGQAADIYVVFDNLESTEHLPTRPVPRVLMYEDEAGALRAAGSDPSALLAAITAQPGGIREEFSGVGTAYGNSGLTFVPKDPALPPVTRCTAPAEPAYLGVTRKDRSTGTTAACARAFCTFCQQVDGRCVGVLRFSADGTVRSLTGPAGSGGILKVVNLDDDRRSQCLAFSEPAGVVVAY